MRHLVGFLYKRHQKTQTAAENLMKGIQFVVDDFGKKRAIQIDLDEWGDLWEDFYDVLVSESRKNEPTVPWSELKAELEQGRAENWLSTTSSSLPPYPIFNDPP